MLKHLGGWSKLSSPSLFLVSPNYNAPPCTTLNLCSAIGAPKLSAQQVLSIRCRARRRVRYEDEDEGEEDEYGHNAEIAMLELYSQSARGEALLVHAMVDDQDVEVLIFKGFSSCLSYRTSPDPSKSILPARAVIKSIDRIKGPFNPSNIEYIEKGLAWDAFKSRLQPN
ncbi:hypothetical protein PVL29_000534 [Vitis rotundifolia]|uniref:DUF7734 domain-containing protein n=1 Tax=Vitis rotundifolia TaxID=103349 RepID=A0AA39AJB2_VITRO|nr:hypothetical protein PVL29_000534 [Vitis rotundifolia]